MCNKMKEKFNSIILLYLSEIYTIVDLNLYVCPVKNTDTLILSVKLKDMFPIQPSGGTPIKYLYYDWVEVNSIFLNKTIFKSDLKFSEL